MDAATINFIGRTQEIDDILEFIKGAKENSSKAIFISGVGGIGKTRLLEELTKKIKKEYPDFVLHKIIDFDNKSYISPDRISLAIIDELEQNEGFLEYFDQLEDIRKSEESNFRQAFVEKQKKELVKLFVRNYNQSANKTNVWLFDTVEKLSESEDEVQINEDIINDWLNKFPKLHNTVFIFAGRNPLLDQLWSRFEEKGGIENRKFNLKPFDSDESRDYISKKQKKLHLNINQDLAEKLIQLAGGKPIFIDLAVEWFIQEMDMDWLLKLDTDQISVETNEEFEEILVSKTRSLRSPIDWIVFVLAHIFPLDKEGFELLFEEDNLTGDTFDKVKKMVFVKTLPSGEIKLHDEMHRLVNKYIFNKIDGKYRRREHYSQKIVSHLEKKYTELEEKFNRKSKEAFRSDDVKKELKFKISLAEDKNILNEVTYQLVIHSIYAGDHIGKHRLNELKEELISGRMSKQQIKSLLKAINHIPRVQSLEDDIDFILDLATLQLYVGQDKGLAKYKQKANDKQKIRLSLLESNFLVRKGELSESIDLLEQAEHLNEQVKDPHLKIFLDIELGWNYRLIGNLEEAKKRYYEAIQLILSEVGDGSWEEHEELAIRYGWTLNNLAFVLSDSNRTRREAVDYAYSAIDHWTTINHKLGLGASHSVLGITYYRIDKSEDAFVQFEKAMEIFEELELGRWICQIHSWRGALYQDRNKKGDLENAKNELLKAKDIAETENPQIIPMTLNRLGRVYMSEQRWNLALEKMLESLKRAKELPEYVYWLGSIGRLGYIIAEHPDPKYNLDFIRNEFKKFKKTVKKRKIQPERNSLGITNLALARLELIDMGKKTNEKQVQDILDLLKEGIPLITEFGSYARTDIKSRLVHLERGFSKVEPEVVNILGDKLHPIIQDKAKSSERGSYLVVLGIINKWRNWKNINHGRT
jgi:tetratricopeptide (TPR) repeat protein